MHSFSTVVQCKSLTTPSPLLPEFQLQPPPDFSEKYNNFRKQLTYVSYPELIIFFRRKNQKDTQDFKVPLYE